ncbi:MAG: hypothetical protein HQM09_00095 [Candidatus Riflebacteria bacterium]|nr:hypothetical protein [Candidatus Riflebacteria bacterium]
MDERNTSPSRHFRAGMSFIEILVAFSLMSLLFVIGWSISNSLIGVKKVRNYEMAIALATQALEAVRAARFREIGSDRENSKDTLITDFSSSQNVFDGEKGEGFVPLVKVGDIEFQRELHIQDCPSMIEGFPSVLKLVQVRVTWKAPEDDTGLTFEAGTTVADTW